MCIGIPMEVIETGEGFALCRAGTELRQIDTMLVDTPEPGAWLLTFLNTAREVIGAEQAAQINDALQALDLAMSGDGNIDHLFADLLDREPELPDFLKSDSQKTT
ncbi:HypC/HybG/HupF family hydrogenase formation chaperone [Thiolapillus sp.]